MQTYTLKGTVTDSVVVRVDTGFNVFGSLVLTKDTEIALFVVTEDDLVTQAQRHSESEAIRAAQLRNGILAMAARYKMHAGQWGGTKIADELEAILYMAGTQEANHDQPTT